MAHNLLFLRESLAQLVYLLVQTQPRGGLSLVDRDAALRADFRDEGPGIHHLQLASHAREAFLGNRQGNLVILDEEHIAKHVGDDLLQALICLRLESDEFEQATRFGAGRHALGRNFKHLLDWDLVESFQRVDFDNSALDFFVELQKFLRVIQSVDNRAEKFLLASYVDYAIHDRVCAFDEVD